MNDAKLNALLDELTRSRDDLAQIAERHGLSLLELGQALGDPDRLAAMQGLCAVSDARAQLRVCEYRQFAVELLARQAFGEEDHNAETRRRAASDLLKLELKRAPERMEEAGDPEQDAFWQGPMQQAFERLKRACQTVGNMEPKLPDHHDGAQSV